MRTEASKGALALARSVSAGKKAGANASRAGDSLVRAVGRLVNRAVDEMLLGDDRVSSAAEGRRLLARNEQTESRADDIQRIIVLAVPVIRALARGARVVKVPWVIVGSTAVGVGVAVRTGVREIQVLSSLVADRLEQATGEPADSALVKKVAIDLYLHPKRKVALSDEKLHIVRLTRKWVLGECSGATRRNAPTGRSPPPSASTRPRSRRAGTRHAIVGRSSQHRSRRAVAEPATRERCCG